MGLEIMGRKVFRMSWGEQMGLGGTILKPILFILRAFVDYMLVKCYCVLGTQDRPCEEWPSQGRVLGANLSGEVIQIGHPLQRVKGLQISGSCGWDNC